MFKNDLQALRRLQYEQHFQNENTCIRVQEYNIFTCQRASQTQCEAKETDMHGNRKEDMRMRWDKVKQQEQSKYFRSVGGFPNW